MTDEPHLTPDSRHPVSLEDRLRAEEPPLHEEDTSPSRRLEARLRAEEPPLSADDTAPSQAVARQRSERSWGVLGIVMALGALSLILIAGLIWTSDDETPVVVPPAERTPVAQAPTQTATLPPVPTSAPEQLEVGPLFPTAAADEIAAALLTPVPAQPVERALLRQSAPFTIRPVTARTRVIQYTVKDGDTLESIAQQFGLKDFYTLIWSNKSSKYNPLRPGVQLNILPEDGVYHEVTDPIRIADLAEMYEVDPYAIIDSEYNDLFGATPETILPPGLFVVVPGGKAERELFLPRPVSVGATSGSTISGTYTLWGCTAEVSGGSPPWSRRPLDNYKWVRGFAPGGHTGVDLSAKVGEPVYAAGAGTVVYAGWSDGGYGNVVVIAHGSTFSLYGHLSRISVRCGQQVSAGTQVGAVGNTGNSSGPHLHFEVRDVDWNLQDPRNYIAF